MKNNTSLISSVLLAILFLSALFAVGYYGIRYLQFNFDQLPLEWTSLLIISIVALIFCALLISNAIKNNQAKREFTILNDRLTVYKRFLDVWLGDKMLLSYQPEPYQLSYAMCLLASDRVLKQYKKFILIHQKEPDNIEGKKSIFERILLEMRKDLGGYNLGILKGDMLFLFDQLGVRDTNHESNIKDKVYDKKNIHSTLNN